MGSVCGGGGGGGGGGGRSASVALPPFPESSWEPRVRVVCANCQRQRKTRIEDRIGDAADAHGVPHAPVRERAIRLLAPHFGNAESAVGNAESAVGNAESVVPVAWRGQLSAADILDGHVAATQATIPALFLSFVGRVTMLHVVASPPRTIDGVVRLCSQCNLWIQYCPLDSDALDLIVSRLFTPDQLAGYAERHVSLAIAQGAVPLALALIRCYTGIAGNRLRIVTPLINAIDTGDVNLVRFVGRHTQPRAMNAWTKMDSNSSDSKSWYEECDPREQRSFRAHPLQFVCRLALGEKLPRCLHNRDSRKPWLPVALALLELAEDDGDGLEIAPFRYDGPLLTESDTVDATYLHKTINQSLWAAANAFGHSRNDRAALAAANDLNSQTVADATNPLLVANPLGGAALSQTSGTGAAASGSHRIAVSERISGMTHAEPAASKDEEQQVGVSRGRGVFLTERDAASRLEHRLQNWPRPDPMWELCFAVRARVDRIVGYRTHLASTVAIAAPMPRDLTEIVAAFVLVAPTSRPWFW